MERIHEGKQLYYLSRVLAASLSENVNPWLRWVWSNERIRSTDRFISRIANNSPREIIIVQRDEYACYDFTKVSITKISRLVETLSFRSIFCAISIAIKKRGEESWEESRRHLCNITIPFLFHSTHTLNLNDYPTQWYHVSFDRIDSTVKRVFKIGVKMNKLLSRGKSRREVSQR